MNNKGTVKWFDAKKGFGFIISEEGNDVFVHHSGILADGYRKLNIGERVSFDVSHGVNGLCAINVVKA
ncbi:MAG: cold shock domain-containing protein [Herbinix sp.]|nr:cold shock domain-containing protein [Herbinix sp.]